MRLIALSLTLLIMSSQLAAHALANFTETLVIDKNLFRIGELFLQISHVDSNGDGIADPEQFNWKKSLTGIASSPEHLLPGESFSGRFFIRNQGNIDVGELEMRIDVGGGGHMGFFENFWLESLWYDRNGNGVEDVGENLLPSIMAHDLNGDNILTYPEIYRRSIRLEHGGTFLPGSATNPALGGHMGTGKSVNITWRVSPTMPLEYAGASHPVNYDIVSKVRASE